MHFFKRHIQEIEKQLKAVQGIESPIFRESTDAIMLQEAFLRTKTPEDVEPASINFIKACFDRNLAPKVQLTAKEAEEAKKTINYYMKIDGKSLGDHLNDLDDQAGASQAQIEQNKDHAIRQAYAVTVDMEARKKQSPQGAVGAAVGALKAPKTGGFNRLMWLEQEYRFNNDQKHSARLISPAATFPSEARESWGDKETLSIRVDAGSKLVGNRNITLSVTKDGEKRITANRGGWFRTGALGGHSDTMLNVINATANERDFGEWRGKARLVYHEWDHGKDTEKRAGEVLATQFELANERMLPVEIVTDPVKGSKKAHLNGQKATIAINQTDRGRKAKLLNDYLSANYGLMGTTNKATGQTPKPCLTTVDDTTGKATHTTDIHTKAHHKAAMHGAILTSIACDLQDLVLSDEQDHKRHTLLSDLKGEIETKQAEDIAKYLEKSKNLPPTTQTQPLNANMLKEISKQHAVLALAGRATADNENPLDDAALTAISNSLHLDSAQVTTAKDTLNTIRTAEAQPDNKNGPVFEAAKHTMLSGDQNTNIHDQLTTAYLVDSTTASTLKPALTKPRPTGDAAQDAKQNTETHNQIQAARTANVTATEDLQKHTKEVIVNTNTTTLTEPSLNQGPAATNQGPAATN